MRERERVKRENEHKIMVSCVISNDLTTTDGYPMPPPPRRSFSIHFKLELTKKEKKKFEFELTRSKDHARRCWLLGFVARHHENRTPGQMFAITWHPSIDLPVVIITMEIGIWRRDQNACEREKKSAVLTRFKHLTRLAIFRHPGSFLACSALDGSRSNVFFSHVIPIVKHNPREWGGGLVRDIFQVVSCCWHVYTHAVCSLTL